jgi:hypothetical protein
MTNWMHRPHDDDPELMDESPLTCEVCLLPIGTQPVLSVGSEEVTFILHLDCSDLLLGIVMALPTARASLLTLCRKAMVQDGKSVGTSTINHSPPAGE